jgi:hypothetical protein
MWRKTSVEYDIERGRTECHAGASRLPAAEDAEVAESRLAGVE